MWQGSTQFVGTNAIKSAEMFVFMVNTTVKTVEKNERLPRRPVLLRSEKQRRYCPSYRGYRIGLRRFGSPA